jgi:protein-disulfide isomerase
LLPSIEGVQKLLQNPFRLAMAAIGIAALLVAVSIVSTRGGSKGSGQVEGVADTQALVSGIPQQGLALGSPKAKLTIEEFADPQCPYCQRWALQMLPAVIPDVRSGKVRLVYRPLAFIGPDSARAARTIVAAGAQDHAWQAIDLLYRNQGGENSGWANQAFLDKAVAALGLDPATVQTEAGGASTTAALKASQDEATSLGVQSTPTIVFHLKGGKPELIDPNAAFDQGELTLAIDQRLNG